MQCLISTLIQIAHGALHLQKLPPSSKFGKSTKNTLKALMLVPSGRVPVTGPNTREGIMVASSKPSFLLTSHAFFSATVCNQNVDTLARM